MAYTTTALLERPAVSESANAAPGNHPRGIRYRYTRIGRGYLTFVIVDIAADGGEDWAEQEPGQPRWHPFTPSQAERAVVQMWVVSGRCPSGRPELIAPLSASR